MKGNAKRISFAALLFVLQILAVPIRAGSIKEADYPVEYKVMEASKKPCSMTLRDQAKTDVAINVEKYGPCHLLDSGKVYRGRQNQKRNEIELVIPVGENKARVENWQIIGTVLDPK